MPRCPMCFKDKPQINPVVVGSTSVGVCKGCRYELDKHIGFLEFYGIGLRELDGALQGEAFCGGSNNQAQMPPRRTTKGKEPIKNDKPSQDTNGGGTIV